MKLKRAIQNRAFSLVELLVVLFVSGILLTLVAIPLIGSFNVSRAAQAEAATIDKARVLGEQISRELRGAAGAYDNTGERGMVAVTVPGNDGSVVKQMLPSARIILLKPAQGSPDDREPGGDSYKDPGTGKFDPTLTSPKGQPIFPATPGDTVVMYFIALKDPFRLYNNPYQQFKNSTNGRWDFSAAAKAAWSAQFQGDVLARQNSGEDNLYTLYRVEVNPYRWEGGQRVVNTEFFTDLSRVDTGALNAAIPEQAALLKRVGKGGADLHDPYLMDISVPSPAYTASATYDPVAGSGGLEESVKGKKMRNLLRKAQIVTDVNKLDMILPQVDRRSLQVAFDSNIPRITGLASFRPAHINGEPAAAQLAVRNGEEAANALKIGSDSFRTRFGSLSGLSLRIFPSQYPSAFDYNTQAGAVRPAWQSGTVLDVLENADGGLSLFANGGTEMFNISQYLQHLSTDPTYAFSRSVVSLTGNETNFIPVVPDVRSGTLKASFDVREFGNPADAATYQTNVPTSGPSATGIETGPQALVSDPTYGASVSWTSFSSPNERFAVLYNNWDTLFPLGNAPAKDGASGPKRSFSLRLLQMFGASSTLGPLHPSNGIARASIAAGSERIYGPDQSPGGNPSTIVLYQRVPNVDSVTVGPNQYKINYVDQVEPDWATLYGFTGVDYDPLSYNATDFLSAVLQEKYRAGYVELNSRIGEPLPVGNFYVTYRFQFTEPKDVVTVSYDSSKTIEAVLSIVTYGNPTTPLPTMTTVPNTAEVRNLLR